MSLPAGVADALAKHVTLEGVHRPDVPEPLPAEARLPRRGGRVLQGASGDALRLLRPDGDPISKEFVVGIHRFIQDRGIDLAHFTKGQRKDDVAKRYLATAARVSCSSGVLRRSRTSSAPRSGSTPRRASATRGS